MTKFLPIQLQESTFFVFDLDGTLVNLEQLNAQAMVEAVRLATGKHVHWEDYKQYFSGAKVTTGFATLFKAKGIPLEAKTMLVLRESFRHHKRLALQQRFKEVVQPIPGASDFLLFLHHRRVMLGLVTSSKREFAETILEHNYWSNYFAVTICAEDVTQGKPSPQGYQLALAAANADIARTTAFEDSRRGVEAAQAAKLFTVGIHTPGLNDQTIHQADSVITDYSELVQYFH